MTARLNPALAVQGHTVHLHPFGLAAFHASELRTPVGKAKANMLAVETALDMLLRGY